MFSVLAASLSHVGWIVRDQWVDKLGDALYYLLERRTDQPGVIFGTLMHLLIELETLDEQHLSFLELSVPINFPGACNPDDGSLFLEVAGLKELAKCLDIVSLDDVEEAMKNL